MTSCHQDIPFIQKKNQKRVFHLHSFSNIIDSRISQKENWLDEFVF